MTNKPYIIIDPSTKGGNYVNKMVEDVTAIDGDSTCLIAHDGWCGIFKSKACDCNPTVIVNPAKEA